MVKVLRKTGAKKTPGNQHRVVLMKVGDGNKGGSGKNVETGASRPKGNDSTRREPKKKHDCILRYRDCPSRQGSQSS